MLRPISTHDQTDSDRATVARIVGTFPPLTPEQRSALRVMLAPVGAR